MLSRIQSFRLYLRGLRILCRLCLSLNYAVIAINDVPVSLYAVLVLIRGAYVALVYDSRRFNVCVPCFNAVLIVQTVTKRCDMMQDAPCLRNISANEKATVEVRCSMARDCTYMPDIT